MVERSSPEGSFSSLMVVEDPDEREFNGRRARGGWEEGGEGEEKEEERSASPCGETREGRMGILSRRRFLWWKWRGKDNVGERHLQLLTVGVELRISRSPRPRRRVEPALTSASSFVLSPSVSFSPVGQGGKRKKKKKDNKWRPTMVLALLFLAHFVSLLKENTINRRRPARNPEGFFSLSSVKLSQPFPWMWSNRADIGLADESLSV